MKIVGLQKLTLLDFPGTVACTVFLGGCNFRCPFCHNSELIEADVKPIMEVDELLSLLKKRKGILEGVCITGGEPTLYSDLPDLLAQIKAMGYKVKLDTNGYKPKMLRHVVENGLVDYVAMDIKNSPTRYSMTIGVEQADMQRIEECISFLMEGHVEYEFRTTVVEPLHTLESVKEMGEWLKSLANGKKIPRIFLQPFVDRDTVMVSGLKAPDEKTLKNYADLLEEYSEAVELRGV